MWWIPAAQASTFMPPAVSEIARKVDSIYGFLLIASFISFVILIGGLIYFILKYRRRSDNDKTAYITHNHTLEFIWSFVPLVIFLFVCAWGGLVYLEMRSVPADEDAIEIHVVGKKWVWEFTYKNGREELAGVDDSGQPTPPTLTVPVNKAVKLIMTSLKANPNDKRDRAVLHSFFVPALRVKQDVVPGRYTKMWFKAEKRGLFNVFCTEYCGTGHSSMLAKIKVVSQAEYDNYVLGESSGGGGGGPKESPLFAKGKKIYTRNLCVGCHSLDGKVNAGPSWKGLWGSQRAFADGSTAVADENYIRESILNPNAKIVKGFQANQMPSFQGQLSDEDIMAVIEFMKKYK